MTLENIDAIAEAIVKELPSYPDVATILLLSGDMGAGKTTLTQAIGRALKISENMPSPTFVMRRDYSLNDDKFSKLIHIDAYRIGPEEAKALDIHNEVSGGRALIIMEWSENIGEVPSDAKINISHVSEFEREILIS